MPKKKENQKTVLSLNSDTAQFSGFLSFFIILQTQVRRQVKMNGKADITVGPNDIAERKETSVLA